jgi:hypothetical protein
MSGWGCPNELKGTCLRVEGRECDPGMKGCILFGRFVFSTPEKNISRHTRAGTEPRDPSAVSPPSATSADTTRDE